MQRREMPLNGGRPIAEALLEMTRKGFGVVGVMDAAARSPDRHGRRPQAAWLASSSGGWTR